MDTVLKTDKISSQITKHNTNLNTDIAAGRSSNMSDEVDDKSHIPDGNKIEVSSVGQLFHAATSKREVNRNAITGQEQASKLALLLHQQFEQDGAHQALKAQAGIQPDFAASLLKG